jgi:hypothetical protein
MSLSQSMSIRRALQNEIEESKRWIDGKTYESTYKRDLAKTIESFYKLNLIRLLQINLCQGGTKEFVFCKGSSNFFGE